LPRFPLLMLIVFAFTLFTSATLLFMVEPMIGKMILPLLGGTPAVWNTAMVFYQAVLLAGYAYAHFSTSWLGARKQAALHLVLLALPFLFLPLAVNPDLIKGGENPIVGLLLLLSMTVGLPMFVVSASAPLLQKWFADTSHPSARDPYFLYGASNLGSMLALLAYPTVVEPYLRLGQQSFDWTVGYGVLAALTALCAVFLWVSPSSDEELIRVRSVSEGESFAYASGSDEPLSGDVTWQRVLRWVALAFVPSSLMLGATTYITTDIAAIPLLWVTPLALYLLSFILVFSHISPRTQWFGLTIAGAAISILLLVFLWDLDKLADRPKMQLMIRIGLVLAVGGGIYAAWWGWFNRHADMTHRVMVIIMPLLVLMMLFFLLSGRAVINLGIGWTLCLHLLTLFVVAMVCHGELARDRPAAKYLTGYYLWMSVGGVLGGLFNGLLAPVIFSGLFEYPLAMMLACLLAPPLGPSDDTSWGRRFDLILAGLFAGFGLLLILLRLPDHDLAFEDLKGSPWKWELAALVLGVAVGAVAAMRARERKFERWMDLVLPLSLGVLLIGLSWGLRSDILLRRVAKIAYGLNSDGGKLIAILTFGLPLVLAYTFVERSLRFALAVGTVLLASGFCAPFDSPPVLHQERGFFGVLRISNEIYRYGADDYFLLQRLDHGTTLHGMQCLNPDRRNEPLTYYHHTGPIGELMLAYNGPDAPPEKMNIAVIGLGTGCMAAHARSGQHLTFYDIDPIVKRFSFDEDDPYFTFVEGARERGAKVDLVMGDARLTMARQQLKDPDKYGMIVVDAFSSDAIPIHLMTLEALDVYLDKLTKDGLIVFHISNRYLDLAPVLYNLAQARGLAAVTQTDYREEEDAPHSSELMAKTSSTWVVLSPSEERLDKLLALNDWEDVRLEIRGQLFWLSLWPDNGAGLSGQAMLLHNFLGEAMCQRPAKWNPLGPESDWPDLKKVGIWTDDYSNLFSVFSWR
jgi:spermidine synthase